MKPADKFKQIFEHAEINVSNVKVLGAYVHIDTFHKYEAKLIDIMTLAGFALHSTSDGKHLDDYIGFRIVFQMVETVQL